MNTAYIGIFIGICCSIWMKLCRPHCPGKSNVINLFNNMYLHLHHWIIALVLLYLFDTIIDPKQLLYNSCISNIIRGVLVGTIAHGLAYQNAFDILYTK